MLFRQRLELRFLIFPVIYGGICYQGSEGEGGVEYNENNRRSKLWEQYGKCEKTTGDYSREAKGGDNAGRHGKLCGLGGGSGEERIDYRVMTFNQELLEHFKTVRRRI